MICQTYSGLPHTRNGRLLTQMPGIVAVVNDKKGKQLLESMINSIKYENWYLTDFYNGPMFAIGRAHLGILNPEAQPIFNEDGSLGIFMDGEVYDYDEQKRNLESNGHKFRVENDPELCLNLYEEFGQDFVRRLNGSFVIVIFDTQNRKMIVTNDRYGLRPFYFAKNGDKYLFASEVKAILRDRTFEKRINHEAVADFFAFEKILGDKTFFKGIDALPPASVLVLSKGKLSIRQYWDFEFEEEHDYGEEYYSENLVRIFKKAVERRMRARSQSNRIGVNLSGGLDSRSIVAAIDKKFYPICTFTYGVKGGDEARIAEKVAKKLGTEHKFFELKPDDLAHFAEMGVYLTDGMCSCYHFHWMSLLKRMKEDIDVVFHGLALGILLGGSYLNRAILNAEDSVLPSLVYKKLNVLVSKEMMPFFFSNEYYRKIKGMSFRSFMKSFGEVRAKHPADKSDCFFLRNYTRCITSPARRSYLEDRIPSFDNDFVDLVLKIPPKLRFEHKIYYRFFRKLALDLAKIPYQKTRTPPMAPQVAHKIVFLIKGAYKIFLRKLRNMTGGLVSIPDKIGYPDYDEWIRKDKNLRKFFTDILLDRKTLGRGYFNEEYVIQMVRDHMSYKKDYGRLLCALVTFELWHRLFFDEHLEKPRYARA